MTITKINKSEWARQIEQGIRKYELERTLNQRKKWRALKKFVSVPIILGCVCIAIYLYLFDWEWMVKGMLNAMIAATLVSVFLTVMNAK